MSESIKQHADRWALWYGVTREQLAEMWKQDRRKLEAHFAWAEKAGLKCQVLPMYKKADFYIDGVIGMVKSTNHRFRVITIFRKIG